MAAPRKIEVAILQAMMTEDDDYLYFQSLKLLAAHRGYLLTDYYRNRNRQKGE